MARNGTLDHARLWAALGIVLFHSGVPGAAIGYAALPFFIMLLVVMALPQAERAASFWIFLQGRAARLLLPWLIWSGVYGGLKLADIILTGRPLSAEFELWMLLTGPSVHLWFLPFAFAASLALYPWARLWPLATAKAPVLILLPAVALVVLGLAQDSEQPIPLPQWSLGLAGVLAGLAVALAQGKWFHLILTLLALAMAGGAAFALGWTTGLLQLMLATVVLLLCITIHRPDTPLSRWAAEVSMGVYLVHPLVTSILLRTTPLVQHSLLMALATMVGALLLAEALRASQHAIKSRGKFVQD